MVYGTSHQSYLSTIRSHKSIHPSRSSHPSKSSQSGSYTSHKSRASHKSHQLTRKHTHIPVSKSHSSPSSSRQPKPPNHTALPTLTGVPLLFPRTTATTSAGLSQCLPICHTATTTPSSSPRPHRTSSRVNEESLQSSVPVVFGKAANDTLFTDDESWRTSGPLAHPCGYTGIEVARNESEVTRPMSQDSC
eukprot:Blabericola_migrator_1__10989@NODE_636_length_7124_cov_153_319683_g467_i0_p3_GENE_NODE_636_length_7124_cov_153_319683_g467_i0NODE_636_length_7124_cov_153_319683_g467_i0_p3_ORF_typecomplete_len191_score13_49Hamartin/PF04388_12/0_59KAR9/PF08580_10/8_3MAP65_ASE1/PF03999_12/12_NODE_636_length_7124_cov_153_319683_g467_i019992571